MKTLFLVLLVSVSIKSFAGEVGEEKKAPCIFADQSAKREAKIVIESSDEKDKKDAKTAISK
jgi:hypothetical protein